MTQKLQHLGLLVQEPNQVQCKGGKLYVQFSDIRDAVLVHDNIHRAEPDCEAEYLPDVSFSEVSPREKPLEIRSLIPAQHFPRQSNKLGLWVSVVAVATLPGLLDMSRTEAVVKRMLDSQGQLSAFHVQQNHDPSVFRAFVHFNDPSMASSAMAAFDKRVVEGAHMTLSLMEDSNISQMAQDNRDDIADSPNHKVLGDLTTTLQALAVSKPAPQMHMVPHARVNRSPHYTVASHHNHVDVNRIREGTDVRTTIMLRNIPNKVDQAMLKRIVDESSWGKYDFMYLRIDFANDCKNCFKSDKVAEISYAIPESAGEEEPFPEPDNQSKMKRSCENAEHVGLFTPNAGQHFRDEQRRRRSQYDRGTRLAALEEHDLDASMQPYMYHSQ
ncbi:meiosis protein mei2 [Colletotrichum liriopes]|uniref:Meiosis protein mei2 n=1 Tax=Colletotrichum liriopes TaxID=708192 RepID=A0AA37GU37_9PEZI|nr:meiosis protein mei2 [Colletotrichum liriopes]